MINLYKVILNNTFQTVHCILKKKYINQYTTKIHNFLFLLYYYYYFLFFFQCVGPTLCNLPETEKHQSEHMNLRHVNIVKARKLHQEHCTTIHFSKQRWKFPKMRCQFGEQW